MTTLVWLRRDLRLADNPALYHAAQKGPVALCYLHCDELAQAHNTAPVQTDLIARQLEALEQSAGQCNIPLYFLRVAARADIPGTLVTLAGELEAQQLYFNAEYPLDELERDRAVARACKAAELGFERFHDRVVVPPGELRTGKGEPYKVFTPFKRAWLAWVRQADLRPLPEPAAQAHQSVRRPRASCSREALFADVPRRNLATLWPAGEGFARDRLQAFVTDVLADYQRDRDFPALAGTSALSPYLALGILSPRQCISAALASVQGEWDAAGQGAQTWISELIWREFYQHVAVDFPQVCRYQPMQAYTEAFPWRADDADFAAWCEGHTGIPIVDAAMRQLNQTGWMHNRLRMVSAMFLTKNLRIDWRMGEAYFMSQLIDGDFAANNGGWQWSASTGTDAAPYFRIFNPRTQSERFDPNGDFIRQYVPELVAVPTKQIHAPPACSDYPAPIVDLSASRKETIALFKSLGELRS
ncbi:deoxyribodipyrimidine photo-lyase [Marinimicrobium alkaliphilum]|uniref:deoxyribodipyrimidine photo-lyase n=1 Tax=Marinimicrobium alkaliphilum TaxID=2202654 RepID=UPI000DBAB6D8|nr:deoxyribodipyrimidine photo-lyase [Marinimicrobium alkaliphilum]